MVNMVFPAAENAEETAEDARTMRVSLDLDREDYRALCSEWQRRRALCEKASFAGIIREALRRSLAG